MLTQVEKQTDFYLQDIMSDKKDIIIRLRETDGKATKLIINYDCPHKKGYEVYELTKMLEEKLCNINKILKLFTDIGFKVEHKIEKVRNMLEQNNTNFTVDIVKNVGNFVEFDQKDLNKISKIFKDKTEADYSKLTYCEMLKYKEKIKLGKDLI
jgi:predicted adenylyl cyclase CyaB